MTWYVDKVEQVVDELTSNGVTFEQYEGVLESGFDYGTDDKGVSPAPAAARSPGSRIPTGTSCRSRGIANPTWSTSVLAAIASADNKSGSKQNC